MIQNLTSYTALITLQSNTSPLKQVLNYKPEKASELKEDMIQLDVVL